MGDDEAVADFPDSDQRAAFCNSEWERAQNMSQNIELAANKTGPIRREMLEGREHVVIPATLVRSQVLSNNLGRTFLPADEITDTWADIANGSPVVLDHPKNRGQPTSARDPAVLNTQGVGRLFNVRAEDGALKGDVFIDPSRTDDVSDLEAVLAKVERGEPAELSTTFPVREVTNESGSHEGKRYDKIIRPGGFDHLAVFAEKEGACSVEDGCGLGVNHKGPCECQGGDMDAENADDVADSIWERLKAHFTREDAVNEEQLEALHEATGLSVERLEEMEDDEVTALADNVLDTKTDDEPDVADNEAADEDDQPEPSVPEAVENELAELREQVEALSEDREAEREQLISTLADNERCPFDESQLSGKPLDELEGLAQMAKVRNYAGAGGPKADNAGSKSFVEPVPHYAENTEQED